MSIDLIFNELSFVPLANDKYAAGQRMSEFVSTLLRARRQGIRGPLRIPETFIFSPLAPGYSLHDWMNDSEALREERQFIRRLATKSPFLLDSDWTESMALEYDFKVNSQRASGCGVAYLLDGLSVSLLSDSCWDNHILKLIVEHLGDGEIQVRSEEITHASRSDHVLRHLDWIKERLAQSVDSGNDLWERRGELFPSLTFCEAVEKQMRELDYGTPMLQPVMNALLALEAFCSAWREGPFDAKGISLKTSPESQSTLQNSRFANARTFLCPDGVERLFTWHAKINTPPWRIHFHFDNATPSTLLIGYIGKHLPTASDRT